MSLKRRILKWGLIGLVLLAFATWFGFRTFLFNPLEDDYAYDVSTLIPRGVDFYLSKADLGRDIDPDLTLAVSEAFEASERGQALEKLPAFQELLAVVDTAEIREEVRRQLSQLPIEVDPLELFGGEDLALAGFFQGGSRAQNDWAVYGRANWVAKMGVALLAYPGLLKLEEQGLSVEQVDDATEGFIAYRLSGGQLERPLLVQRIQDVVILGTDAELFRQVPQLVRTRGENSFGLSAKYEDQINLTGRDGDELELFVDYRGLAESKGWSGRWPDTKAEEFLPAYLGRFFQAGAINEVIGHLTFGRVVSLDLHTTLSSEVIEGAQKRLYRRRGFDRETVLSEVAQLIPQDVGLFAYGVGDVHDLLHEALASSEDALVSNLEDMVRSVWSYDDCDPMIEDLDAMFADRFAFCMRANDYEVRDDDPPHDGAVVPAWALVLWVEDPERVKQYRETIHSRQADFLIQGREPGSKGVFEHTLRPSGKLVYEYWSPMVPGTGHMATLTDELRGGTVFMIGNNHNLVGQMSKTYFDGASGGAPRLSELPTFRTQVGAALPSANLLLWVNPKTMARTWRGMAQRWASDKVVIDWSVERPRLEQKFVKENMPGAVWGQLTESQQEELDLRIQPELDSFEAQFRGQHSARFEADYRDRIAAFEAFDAALLVVGFDKSSIDVSARLKFPLE
ncbi:MAG: hypothetical protein AAF682_24595 [Planctomycetota bacterium]